jgi:branched-chain amino acid transport system ATP-binding protein
VTEQLQACGITVDFAGLRAVDTVDLQLGREEILGLIGPNGAGKTTVINVLSGFQRPGGGAVIIDGAHVTALAPAKRARLGLARTFQNVRLFAGLTVAQNVEAAALAIGAKRRAARERAVELLERFGLSNVAQNPASSLPYGQERRLGLARALATAPRYLLLDEPAAGLNEREGTELWEILRALPERDGCGVLLIEHDMRLVMRLCHRIQVIDHGQTISLGTPEQVRSDPAVLEAYLGTGHTVAADA